MSMIDKAAQAVAEELARQEPEKGGTYWVDAANLRATIIDGTFDLEGIARAVITAIREPTEDMCDIGGMEERWDGQWRSDPGTRANSAATWQSMIDAILADDPTA